MVLAKLAVALTSENLMFDMTHENVKTEFKDGMKEIGLVGAIPGRLLWR